MTTVRCYGLLLRRDTKQAPDEGQGAKSRVAQPRPPRPFPTARTFVSVPSTQAASGTSPPDRPVVRISRLWPPLPPHQDATQAPPLAYMLPASHAVAPRKARH
jgi:hypothetical protein